MNQELVDHIAGRLSQRDWEHSGHQEYEDFYQDFAEIAIRAYEEFVFPVTDPSPPAIVSVRDGEYVPDAA